MPLDKPLKDPAITHEPDALAVSGESSVVQPESVERADQAATTVTADEESAEPGFDENSIAGTVIVALCLCLVCSLLVSSAAVGLRPQIAENQELKKRRNILQAAGRWDDATNTNADVEELFQSIETKLINLPGSKEYAPAGEESLSLYDTGYDQEQASTDPSMSVPIEDGGLPGFKQREPVSAVYLVRDDEGNIEQYVLPVYGKGLWSTLYGFLALDADTRTIRGITFYKDGETPGLGGEINNPKWKAQWDGKVAYDESGEPAIDVVKGRAATGEHEIDGLSGATITSNGVEDLINYWLGDNGFGPFLDRMRAGQAQESQPPGPNDQ